MFSSLGLHPVYAELLVNLAHMRDEQELISLLAPAMAHMGFLRSGVYIVGPKRQDDRSNADHSLVLSDLPFDVKRVFDTEKSAVVQHHMRHDSPFISAPEHAGMYDRPGYKKLETLGLQYGVSVGKRVAGMLLILKGYRDAPVDRMDLEDIFLPMTSVHRMLWFFTMRLAVPKIIKLGDTPITPKEMEVLRWATEGVSSEQIAQTLQISKGTVDKHVASLERKLHANNRAQAVAIAQAINIL